MQIAQDGIPTHLYASRTRWLSTTDATKILKHKRNNHLFSYLNLHNTESYALVLKILLQRDNEMITR